MTKTTQGRPRNPCLTMFHPLVGTLEACKPINPTSVGRLAAKVPYKDLVGKSRKDLGRLCQGRCGWDILSHPLMDILYLHISYVKPLCMYVHQIYIIYNIYIYDIYLMYECQSRQTYGFNSRICTAYIYFHDTQHIHACAHMYAYMM